MIVPDSENNEIIIILVHGTFAPDAQWTGLDSQLVNVIGRELGTSVRFERFIWPGRLLRGFNNSHSARLEAGRKLRDVLIRLEIERKPKRLFVIAHSHGGNVALYAARDTSEVRLDAVVFLATPFITCFPRSLPDPFLQLVKIAAWTFLIMMLIVPILVIPFAIDLLKAPRLFFVLIAIAVMGASLVSFFLIVSGEARRQIAKLETWISTSANKIAQAYSATLSVEVPLGLPVYCAWSLDDEAFDALNKANRIFTLALSLIRMGFSDSWESAIPTWILVCVAFGGAVWLLGLIAWFYEVDSSNFLFVPILGLILLPVCLFLSMLMGAALYLVARTISRSLYPLAIPFVLGATLLRDVAHGATDLLAEYLCEIKTEQIPRAKEGDGEPSFIKCKKYKYSGEGLRHSLHSNEEVARDIGRWLKRRRKGSGADDDLGWVYEWISRRD